MVVKLKIFVVIISLLPLNCSIGSKLPTVTSSTETEQAVITPQVDLDQPGEKEVVVGAARVGEYASILKGKRIALLVNQTSMIGSIHLVDTLLASGLNIVKIFAPEHGFRGEADAGEKIKNNLDPETGIPLISLYGSSRKPSKEDLAGVDWVVFDIQDVGARFYTYISTMSYVMEACAEQDLSFMVLDRPNPNGHYVDGPILQKGYESFIGLHHIPVVHGMTVGEYAQMVNGEGWLKNGLKCDLKVITCQNYDHQTPYSLPVRPSPNLPNMRSIYLYPSICYFEGTDVNVGRGTSNQFQVYGHPSLKEAPYLYLPLSKPGAKHPKHKGSLCKGYDLTGLSPDSIRAEARLNLSYLINFYHEFPDKEAFFLKNGFFDKLAGSDQLRKQIIAGKTEAEIRETWQDGLAEFRAIRGKYLLYEE
ncbi:MAG: hypothetical protein DHS20C18_09470 [Saprospiraceae bacterium]|nr:MAG: hypothetical protein DHS20C18_09470 [Saprospiraceae bacterium]